MRPTVVKSRVDTFPYRTSSTASGTSITNHARWHAISTCIGGPQSHGPQIACPRSHGKLATASAPARHPPHIANPIVVRAKKEVMPAPARELLPHSPIIVAGLPPIVKASGATAASIVSRRGRIAVGLPQLNESLGFDGLGGHSDQPAILG